MSISLYSHNSKTFAYRRVLAVVEASVRLSVCLSVTKRVNGQSQNARVFYLAGLNTFTGFSTSQSRSTIQFCQSYLSGILTTNWCGPQITMKSSVQRTRCLLEKRQEPMVSRQRFLCSLKDQKSLTNWRHCISPFRAVEQSHRSSMMLWLSISSSEMVIG